jgi:hypothetical protein
MNPNDRFLLGALAIGVGSSLLAWAIVAGAFAPPGQYGWIYEYQTLIGVSIALLGALLTINMMRREQRQQREHFDRQMNVLTRPDRLCISRETANVIPQLQRARWELQRMPSDVANAEDGLTKYRITFEAVHRAMEAIREEHFANLMPFLEDEFTRRRAALSARLYRTYEALPPAFGAKPSDPVAVTYGIPAERAVQIIEANHWQSFVQDERDLQWLINYLQRTRAEYGLPPLEA